MKKLTTKWMTALVSLVLLCGVASVPVYAEEAGGTPEYHKKLAELKKLKEENPEAFRQKVLEKKEKLKERLQELKEKILRNSRK